MGDRLGPEYAHSSARITLEYYAGVFNDESDAARNGVGEWLSKAPVGFR